MEGQGVAAPDQGAGHGCGTTAVPPGTASGRGEYGGADAQATRSQTHRSGFDDAPNQSAKVMAAMPRGHLSSTIRRTNQG